MSEILMYDTASSTFQGGVPDNAEAVLWYFDGRFANGTAARRRFAHLFANKHNVGLTVGADGRADGIDIEPGNRGPGAAVPFVHAAHAAGVWRPVLYADLTDMRAIIGLLEAAGIKLGEPGVSRPVRLLPAHPIGDGHICGPHTCGQLPVDADGTQNFFGSIQGHGADFDRSTVRSDFFPALTVVDPMHYARYDDTLRVAKCAPRITERAAVERYDVLRALQLPNHHPDQQEIKALQEDLRWYRSRLDQLLTAHPPAGHKVDCTSAQSKANFWCWRRYRINERIQGGTVHP